MSLTIWLLEILILWLFVQYDQLPLSVKKAIFSQLASLREMDSPPPVNQTLCICMHILNLFALVSKIATG